MLSRLSALSLILGLGVACSTKYGVEGEDPEGVDGSDGVDGADGLDGSDGADGTDGSDGADGTDGTDGSDGGAVDADDDGWPADEDCDDGDPDRYPGAIETCNDIDDNCDGEVDEGLTDTFYRDGDGDGYGVDDSTLSACSQPDGYATLGGDCVDTDSSIHPGLAEVCDGVDNDCDGSVDEGVLATFYVDSDNDGYGSTASAVQACTQPSGYVISDGDCDDSQPSAFPGGVEVCDSVDNDCDGSVDEGVLTTWYADADSDGYGSASSSMGACAAPSGHVASNTDCNDADADVNPGATEICNGVDDDCNGATSENGTVTFTSASGAQSSATATFSGSSSSPAAATLTTAGTYTFCDGTYYANIAVAANIRLESATGSSYTTLDGGSAGSVLHIDTDGITVEIEGFEVTHGAGDGTAFSFTGTGGGLNCQSNASLTVRDSVFTGNSATDGGGLAVDGCALTLDDVLVTLNTATYGAGLDVGNGSATFTDVDVAANTASSTGGGLYLSGDAADSTLDWTGGSITDNDATYGAALMLDGALYEPVLRLDAVEVTGNASTNSTYGGAALILDGGELSVTDGDWGSSATGDDNSSDDVTTVGTSSQSFDDYASDSWFICDETGCGPYIFDNAAGSMLFLYGEALTPNTFSCDLYYAVTGTGTSTVCDDCAFGFDLAFTYSASLSTNDGTCSTGNLAWTVGYAPNPTNYSAPVLYYYDSGTWYPTFYADFDGQYLSFGGGSYNDLYGGYYYTRYWYGRVEAY